tara:strand:+ start:1550 stop:2596 length:1047 start_codon:yes stop_codon:yes gene_type:complete
MIDYQTISALNQSTLKQMLISPQAYIKAKERQLARVESTEQHFVFGSVVDMLLTESKEDFDKKYAVIPDDTGVSETVGKIVQGVYDYVKVLPTILDLDQQSTTILECCNFENYQAKWKDETRVNKIIDQGSKYFDILKKSGTKSIITETEYAKAVNCVMALRSDKHTSKYCQKKSSNPDIEIINKHVVVFEHRGLEFKGELDRVIVDHKEKVIIPIDFKTTSKSVLNFENSFWFYRYDFQAAVYSLGLSLDKSERLQKYYQDGYSIKPILYIVVETFLNNPPMVFEISKSAIDVGLYGNIHPKTDPKIKGNHEGFQQAIDRFKYATDNDAWDYNREYHIKGKHSITLL